MSNGLIASTIKEALKAYDIGLANDLCDILANPKIDSVMRAGRSLYEACGADAVKFLYDWAYKNIGDKDMSWSSNGMENLVFDYAAHQKIDELSRRIEQLQKEIALMSKMNSSSALTPEQIESMIGFVLPEEKDDARFLIKSTERNLNVKIAAVSGRKDELLRCFMSEDQADLLIKAYRK